MAPVKPAVQPSNENYPGQKHEHMQQLVTQNYDPNAATTVALAWQKIGKTFSQLAGEFNQLVNSSQGGWQGAAADGVRQALAKVGKFADDTGAAFQTTAVAIADQRDAAIQANRTMPTPVEFSPSKIMGKWGVASMISPVAMIGGPIEMMSKHNEQQEAKAEAVQVMQTRDSTMMSAAMSMPTMESTPQVTQDQGVTQPSSTTHSQSLSNVNSNQRFSNTGMPSTPSSTGNGTTNPSWVAPQVKDPNLPGNPNNPPGGQNRPPYGPPGAFPPGMRPPGGTGQGRPPGGGQGMRPGGPGGPGGGAGGRGPGGMGGMASGRGMGSFGPSTPGGGAGVAGPGGGPGGGGAGAAGRGGAAGAAGAGGAGGGAGQGEEDKEHKSNYLVPTDEFFDDDRMVAPPVIGG